MLKLLSLQKIINAFKFLHLFVAETPDTECSIRSQDDASGARSGGGAGADSVCVPTITHLVVKLAWIRFKPFMEATMHWEITST
jgi:hypothetical protein